jgi:hypothetical protein
MDLKTLLQSATNLPQVSSASAQEYKDSCDILVARINQRMCSRSDIRALTGEHNLDLMKDNHSNHARFMTSIFIQKNPLALVDTILWVFRAYRARGFETTYWAAQLNAWIELIGDTISAEACSEILPYYEWMLLQIPSFTVLSELPVTDYKVKTPPDDL